MSIEVPARRRGRDGSRYEVPVSDSGLGTTSLIGVPAESGAAARLALLHSARTAAGASVEEVIFRDDRQFAVSFVRSLVWQARSRLLFVDPYFSFDDIRDFVLSTGSGSCRVGVLTGSEAAWAKPLGHFATDKLHGELMAVDLKEINRIRTRNALPPVDVRVMGARSFHDRFLIVDDNVWLFGNSFRSLGDGRVSMATRIKNTSTLLALLEHASSEAELFFDFWARVKPMGNVE